MKQDHLNKCCNKSITDTLETVNIAKRFSCANVRGKGQEILFKGMSMADKNMRPLPSPPPPPHDSKRSVASIT